jgi:ABC-type branched-subunit amino acid transport system ATPase component
MDIKEPILRTRDLTKGFGALKAVNRINLEPFSGRRRLRHNARGEC